MEVEVRGHPARVPTSAPPLPRDPRGVTYIPGEPQTPAAWPQLSNPVFPRRNQPAGLTSVRAARRPNSAARVQSLPGRSENRGGAAARAGGQRAWVLTDQPDSEHQLCIGLQDRGHLPPLPRPRRRYRPSSWPRLHHSSVPSGWGIRPCRSRPSFSFLSGTSSSLLHFSKLCSISEPYPAFHPKFV